MQRTVFDVGMYDGADTEYYLYKGFNVVAVEANPDLAAHARVKFGEAVTQGRLIVENVAVASTRGQFELCLPQHDIGSSSLIRERLDGSTCTRSVTVQGVPFADLLNRHGAPYYLKVDIEGCDELCIRSLDISARPTYVSFEMGEDSMELAAHLKNIGYSQFKIISQTTFKQLNQHGLLFRAQRRTRTAFGLPNATRIERDGWCFAFGHSSGPMAEATSGKWQAFEEMRTEWIGYKRHRTYDVGGWFDLHARLQF